MTLESIMYAVSPICQVLAGIIAFLVFVGLMGLALMVVPFTWHTLRDREGASK